MACPETQKLNLTDVGLRIDTIPNCNIALKLPRRSLLAMLPAPLTACARINMLNATIEKDSWGPALQVGVDIPLGGNLYLNVDVKKVYIRTDVFACSANLGTFKVDPVLFGLGLGWRF